MFGSVPHLENESVGYVFTNSMHHETCFGKVEINLTEAPYLKRFNCHTPTLTNLDTVLRNLHDTYKAIDKPVTHKF